MHRRPKFLETEQSGRERWLISYTDIVTLLLVLFVAAAAQGLHVSLPIQAAKVAQAPQPITKDVPAPPTVQAAQPAAKEVPASPAAQPADPAAAPPANPRRALVEAEQRLRQYGLDPRLEQRGLVISLPQAILFPSGEDRVAPSAFPILAQIAQVVSGIPNKVALVGHADSLPIHNARFQNNWQLSAARSLSLLALLTGRYGIPEARLSLQSYGSNEPKGSNDTEAGRAENRRVEILILDDAPAAP